jgi:hypothetical protein
VSCHVVVIGVLPCAAIAICSTLAPTFGTSEFLAAARCMPLAAALANHIKTMHFPGVGGDEAASTSSTAAAAQKESAEALECPLVEAMTLLALLLRSETV